VVVAIPYGWATWLQSEEPEHPLLVRTTTSATELAVETYVTETHAEPAGRSLNISDRANLTGRTTWCSSSKKTGTRAASNQLLNLRDTGSQGRPRIPVGRCLTDSVSFVAQQHVDSIALCIDELVEVLEQRPNPRGAATRDLSQGLGEST
jgi:hypothetical protein